MSPLDDQLRSTLHARADVLAPSPDPLAGIESRARRLRRRRVSASLAGVALAVTAAAVVVPSLAGTSGKAKLTPSTGTTSSTTSPLPANAMRQSAGQVGSTTSTEQGLVDLWAQRHPGPGTVYSLMLMDGSSKQTPVLTYSILEIWRGSGPAYAVVAQDVKTFPVFVRDAVLTRGVPIIDGVVSGAGGGPDVIYTLGQGVRKLDFDPGNGSVRTLFAHINSYEDVSGVIARPGPTQHADAFIATMADGSTVRENVYTGPTDVPGQSDGEPTNLLGSWPQRGVAADGPSVSELQTRFAQGMARPQDSAKVHYRALFVSRTAGGVRYTVGQAWFSGESEAYNVAYATGGTGGPDFFLGRKTAANPVVIAAVICCDPGTSVDHLVIVPTPRTGQVMYSATGTGAFVPKSGPSSFDGVVVIDRDPRATNDAIAVYDGNGNLDHPTYKGPVAPLLCGLKSCG